MIQWQEMSQERRKQNKYKRDEDAEWAAQMFWIQWADGSVREVTFDQRPEGNEERSPWGSGCPRIHESFQEERIASGDLLRWGLDMFEKWQGGQWGSEQRQKWEKHWKVTMCAWALCACVVSRVWLFVISGTLACQSPLSMEFSRQEHWIGLPAPSLGDLGAEPTSLTSPAWAGGLFYHEHHPRPL